MRVLSYVARRVSLTLRLAEALETVPRTSRFRVLLMISASFTYDGGHFFAGHNGQISNWLQQPVPFPYFHVLTLLLLVDLLLISYGLVQPRSRCT